MNQGLARTTITVPKNLYKQLRVKAASERKSFSAYITDILEDYVYIKKPVDSKNPMKYLGRLNIGVNKVYEKRSDIYSKRKTK